MAHRDYFTGKCGCAIQIRRHGEVLDEFRLNQKGYSLALSGALRYSHVARQPTDVALDCEDGHMRLAVCDQGRCIPDHPKLPIHDNAPLAGLNRRGRR